MDRRSALRHLFSTVPVVAVMPSVLVSCKDTELFPEGTYQGSVIVVGAGAAGMYTAWLLQQRGVDVTILEATERHGGRIRPLEGFSDFPIELGAEEIHGKRSIWYDLITASGAEIAGGENEDFVWFDNQLQEEDILDSDAGLKDAQKLLENISDYEGADITVNEWIAAENLPDSVHPYLNTIIGNENGASNDRIGVRGLAEADGRWTSGNQNYLLAGGSHLNILEETFDTVLDTIVYNTAVRSISYTGDNVVLTDQNNETYTADKVVLAVPLPILADEYITFDPELPEAKLTAAKSLGMGAGMKIILKFSERFWPENMGSIVGGEVVPEYWSTGTGRSADNNVLTAFVHGSNAEALVALGTEAIPTVLGELAAMYERTPAAMANLLVDSYTMDWAAEPFIRGTYSFPMPGSDGAREVLAEPLVERIYFAGEATNTNGHFSTVHGALETGARAALEILRTSS